MGAAATHQHVPRARSADPGPVRKHQERAAAGGKNGADGVVGSSVTRVASLMTSRAAAEKP